MRKRRVLKLIAKTKIVLSKVFIYLFGESKKEDVLLSNERQILKLLFSSGTETIKTEDSIKLYKAVSERYYKELDKRERRAKAELSAILSFTSEDNSFEQGELKKVEFQKI